MAQLCTDARVCCALVVQLLAEQLAPGRHRLHLLLQLLHALTLVLSCDRRSVEVEPNLACCFSVGGEPAGGGQPARSALAEQVLAHCVARSDAKRLVLGLCH